MGSILDILLEPLKNVSRLVKKFKMLSDTSFPFWKFYKVDKELIELQQKINDGRIVKFSICLLAQLFLLALALKNYLIINLLINFESALIRNRSQFR